MKVSAPLKAIPSAFCGESRRVPSAYLPGSPHLLPCQRVSAVECRAIQLGHLLFYYTCPHENLKLKKNITVVTNNYEK